MRTRAVHTGVAVVPGRGRVDAAPVRGKWVGRYAGFCSRDRSPSTAISLGTTLPQPSSGLPDTSASRVNGVCLTLLRARFTQRARSLGPLVVSYTTVSPLPPAEAGGGLLSVALFSRISPGGCYPPPCSAEPGRSSAESFPSRGVPPTRPSGRPTCTPRIRVRGATPRDAENWPEAFPAVRESTAREPIVDR